MPSTVCYRLTERAFVLAYFFTKTAQLFSRLLYNDLRVRLVDVLTVPKIPVSYTSTDPGSRRLPRRWSISWVIDRVASQ